MRPARLACLAILPVTVSLGACVNITANDYSPRPQRAVIGDFGEAALFDAAGRNVGRATLTQGPTGLLIRIEADGLTPGWHGAHIHAVGQCAAPFTSAGGHINHAEPRAPHGLLNAGGPDDGDLPNVFADAQGRVRAEVFTTRARIAGEGPGQWLWDSDGSALVIHANMDDHASQPIGGAGDRVVCGVMAAG
ncbi:superoxide dismutase family protein [Brevundimonas sp.]|uniref:superoxide dismutase family protein n=1 Tax=Brevundimonas sp. TaxID=1871086 RepID=UPI002D2A877A|nr:superoxide dismutase family protein [Brevundimonas sp.]HYC74527.1 superoxide dismutase family protein [Brevundimonas sp.]